MGISNGRLNAHIQKYETQYENYRKSWPRYLYRHEPIENALRILQHGALLSRNAASQDSLIGSDIAPDQIIQASNAAHNWARLYFRPKNPTQYHIEGIRKPAEYYGGKHAGFTIMFMFDALAVLTLGSTQFSDGNMQSPYSTVYDGDDGFDELNFDAIYHDAAYPSQEVIRQRCAEVLAVSGLPLNGYLKHIAVRTNADFVSLEYFLGEHGLDTYLPALRQTTGSGLFFNRYTAVDHIDASPNRVNFKLSPTSSAGKIQTGIQLLEIGSRRSLYQLSNGLEGNKRYYFEHDLPAGDYLVNVSLEGVFAHEGRIALS